MKLWFQIKSSKAGLVHKLDIGKTYDHVSFGFLALLAKIVFCPGDFLDQILFIHS